MQYLSSFRSVATQFLDFLFPLSCIVCSHPASSLVCDECWQRIPRVTKDSVLYTSTLKKLTSEGTIHTLASCYIFEHNGSFQHIVHGLKYRGYTSLGIQLGETLASVIQELSLSADIVLPVPLHKRKHRERGYNQSEFLAQGIARKLSIPWNPSLLIRQRYTQSQTKLSADERRQNMLNAFALRPSSMEHLSGKTCIIVDDVITTGSTIKACAEVLLQAQPNRIIAASAAIAQESSIFSASVISTNSPQK